MTKKEVLLEACEKLVAAIEELGHARACSYYEEYDGEGDQWRDHIEICLLEPYDQVQAAIAMFQAEHNDNTMIAPIKELE